MKKIFILKTIVDILWIISWPLILIALCIVPYLFINDDFSSIPINIRGNTILHFNLLSKIILSIMTISILLLLYSLYLFKRVLLLFMRRKIFDNIVLTNLNKIGVLLTFFSIINIICSFIYNINFGKIEFEISINPLVSTLCLGLFFMVLSEIFKIARDQKEENDLTI